MAHLSDSPPGLILRQLAVQGERARRTAAFWRGVRRLAPAVALASAVLAAGSVGLGGPRWLGLLVIVVATAVTLGGWIAARRHRPSVSDAAMRQLDRDAGLGGIFQSAHWFASAPREVLNRVDDAWLAFHLSDAAERVGAVNWSAVYARPRLREPAAAMVAAFVCAAAVAAWPSPPAGPPARGTVVSNLPDDGGTDGDGALPAALVSGLVEGVEAIKAGKPPSAEALAAIGQLLEMADREPVAQKQLDDLLKEASPQDVGDAAPTEAAADSGRGRGRDAPQESAMTRTGLEWAYQEALARSVEARQPSPVSDPTVLAGPEESEDGSRGDLDHGGRGPQASAPASAEPKGDDRSFSSLLFGRNPAGEGSASAPAGRTGAALAAALRSEVIHAEVDIAVAGAEHGARRRATTVVSPPETALGSTAGITYDRGRAAEPPPVPRARRAAVREFFVRPAEPPAPVTPP